MITIERTECKECDLCVEICHEHCIEIIEGVPNIEYAFCSTCAQCVAVCPRRVFSWENLPTSPYDRSRLPSAEQLDELYKERRTIRLFKKDKIDRVLIEEIVRYGIYAPTENFHLRTIAVDDEAIIAELDQVLLRLTRRIYNLVKPKFLESVAQMIGYAHTLRRSKAKLKVVVERGRTFLTPPAAWVFIVGDKSIPLSDASAQFALANIMYYAQIKGLGCGLSGNGQLFLDKDKSVRRRLGLGKRENILGALVLGYSLIRFSNKVTGKDLPIQWNSGEAA